MTTSGSRRRDYTRRDVLTATLAVCAVGLIGRAAPPTDLLSRIRRVLSHARRSSTEFALARAIVFGAAREIVSFDRWNDAELRSTIRQNIATDYRAGRLVSHFGWRISATEMRALELMCHQQAT